MVERGRQPAESSECLRRDDAVFRLQYEDQKHHENGVRPSRRDRAQPLCGHLHGKHSGFHSGYARHRHDDASGQARSARHDRRHERAVLHAPAGSAEKAARGREYELLLRLPQRHARPQLHESGSVCRVLLAVHEAGSGRAVRKEDARADLQRRHHSALQGLLQGLSQGFPDHSAGDGRCVRDPQRAAQYRHHGRYAQQSAGPRHQAGVSGSGKAGHRRAGLRRRLYVLPG